jgi:uncharacterized membrane protein YeaQ/YmgE (transglycosylase-associated protein family)
LETQKFRLIDILYGVIIPLVLVLLIFVLAIYVNPNGQFHVLGVGTDLLSTVGVIFTQGFAQMIVLGIPLALGLLWNKWAGGAAGFITGGAYYMASAGLYNGYYVSSTAPYHNFYGDPSMLFWIVYGVMIGYMAGALVNGSSNFKRMLGAGLTAGIINALLQVYMNYNWALDFKGASTSAMDYSPRNMAHGLWAVAGTGIHNSAGTYIPLQYTAGSIAYGFTLAFIPLIALGVIVPIIAKVMMWYGIQPVKHQ